MFLFIYKLQKNKKDLKVIQGHTHYPSTNYTTGFDWSQSSKTAALIFSSAKMELRQSARLVRPNRFVSINM